MVIAIANLDAEDAEFAAICPVCLGEGSTIPEGKRCILCRGAGTVSAETANLFEANPDAVAFWGDVATELLP